VGAHIITEELGPRPGRDLVIKPLRLIDVPGARRSGNQRDVVASILGVLALVGCVTAIVILATQPTADRLQSEIASLDSRLGAARSQLMTLQSVIGHVTSQGSRLTRDVHRLDARAAGLQRTVHGLQSSTSLTREAAAGLRVCFPQLQQELSGLILKTRSVKGHVTSVGLSYPPLLSPACETLPSRL
jgi:hypothetical protein